MDWRRKSVEKARKHSARGAGGEGAAGWWWGKRRKRRKRVEEGWSLRKEEHLREKS